MIVSERNLCGFFFFFPFFLPAIGTLLLRENSVFQISLEAGMFN